MLVSDIYTRCSATKKWRRIDDDEQLFTIDARRRAVVHNRCWPLAEVVSKQKVCHSI